MGSFSIKLGTCKRCGNADTLEILKKNDGLCFICAGGLDEDLKDDDHE